MGAGEYEEPSGEQKQRGKKPLPFFLILSSLSGTETPQISRLSKKALRSGLHLKTAASPVPLRRRQNESFNTFGCINGRGRDERKTDFGVRSRKEKEEEERGSKKKKKKKKKAGEKKIGCHRVFY